MGFGFDLDKGATAISNAAKKALSDTGLAKGLNQASSMLSKAKDAVTSGLGINISNITSAIPGAAQIESALDNARAALAGPGNLADNLASYITKTSSGITGTVPNILHYYSSVNYLFTLSVLDDAQINFPNETYRKGILGPLILKSASGSPGDRVPTPYKTSFNPTGSFEFFIEDLRISSSIGFDKKSGNTNATGFTFKIIEPMSMGLFFEVLQASALTAGHKNYLDMPLLMTLEFKGHIDANMQNVQIDKTTKYFPLKLMTLDMKVTGKGSEYTIEAYPFNEKAYSTTYSQLKTDVSISGQSVKEMLQTGEKSLQRVLNDRLQEAVKRKDVNVADQILISFPKDLKTGDYYGDPYEESDTSATVNPNASGADRDLFKKLGVVESSVNKTQVQVEGTMNDIGNSTMGFNLYNKGSTPFAKDNLSYDEKTGTYVRGGITINPNQGEFKFAQGSDVINAINQVILMSEYGRSALSQITPDRGMVQWWRVETHLYYIPTDANIAKTGVKPKLVVYRVVPYYVSASVFLPPNTPNPGTEEIKKKVIKEYNYIYTGKNVDIIDWDISFNAGFYTAMNSDGGKNTGDAKIQEQASGATSGDESTAPVDGQAPAKGQIPTTVLKDGVLTSTAYKGGGGLDDNASIAARQFHDAVTSGVDMISLDLTILGDPYYLGDSGVGNYSAVATDNPYINSDGAMDWQSGEVHINLNFRTPVDINQGTGLYDFTSTSISQFSGIYKVLTVDSTFQRGKFTQVLKMVRLKGQEVESTKPPRLAFDPGPAIVDPTTQVFDDGSSIQTFDDGSTLVTDNEGGITSTPGVE